MKKHRIPKKKEDLYSEMCRLCNELLDKHSDEIIYYDLDGKHILKY